MNLYTQKYSDANFTHFCELLAKNENIIISSTTIRNWLFAQDILSPKARRKTIKKLKADIKQREKTLTKKEANISTTIKLESLSRHEAHPRRSRCAYAGELIQLDASPHVWFGSTMTHLHLAIDDATGMIVGAYFDEQETLKAYYNVQYQILTTYGIPAKYLTDRRTIFDYKRKNAPSDSEDTFTQFAYACHQLGIELESTSVPQAKGRVERLNQTLQSRLVVEMRLASVDSIESANKFISSYIKEYNLQFSIPLNSTKNVYEKQPTFPQIDKILAVISNRKLDAGHCIRYKNKYYIPIARSGSEAYFHKGAHALVIESFSG
ncbi:MAG: ISNCY family transposase, partial [Fusobacteriaceae bacterium]